jgi:hypothetical protein
MAPARKSTKKAPASDVAQFWRQHGFDFAISAPDDAQRNRGYHSRQVARLSGDYAGLVRVADQMRLAQVGNRERVDDFLGSSSRDSFAGGSMAKLRRSLSGDIEMAPFESARQKLANSDLMNKLRARLGQAAPKRRRINSEYDGEWDFDRRWESTPFAATTRPPAIVRVITIEAEFAMSGGADSEMIDRYGATVWALCSLIESYGIQARIVWRNSANNTSTDAIATDVRIEIKKPGEYLPPSFLAATFQSLFYRRMGFAMIVAACDLAGKTCGGGLGSPIHRPAVEFLDGVLSLGPNVGRGYTDELEGAIMQAIGAK